MGAEGRLAGRIAWVTGGSSGLGAAFAGALAQAGAGVVAVGRRFPDRALSRPPESGEVVSLGLDIADEAHTAELMSALPRLDIVVNAAGVASFGTVSDVDSASVRAMLESVVGAYATVRAALPTLMASPCASVVNVGSIASAMHVPDAVGYTAAKSGLAGFSRALGVELRPSGVRVTALLLGAVDTPLWDERPFDRAGMLRAADVATLLVDIVANHGMSVDELVITPPGGVLNPRSPV